eukprot:CAMPEP_0177273104 /NCGR_PEP_ID=MMETSP0367-20130122/66433_1 /TAXON_ID=447022 ORGANISM="Scrippsiella hangoei-like, Strain SHHI-4" /NCGR_SAMPLE_ID=MMETSP0367 /ASSEMBLY_ACC=CAM_ASM_000362 /LENGTH=60 /DNA_ID=CAMNT_0018729305 /DNA_START=8 /DNA_END=187 /DNA_ORIENTATION=+
MLQRKRPPSELLEERLPCGFAASTALSACENAGVRCGFRVVCRTATSLVLMPGPRMQLLS